MRSPTEHDPAEPGFADLPTDLRPDLHTDQAGEAPRAFIAAVRARRRVVRTRRVSAALLVGVVAVAGWRFAPTPATNPGVTPTPSLAESTPDGVTLPEPAGPGVTLASLRRLWAEAEGPGLPEFPRDEVPTAEVAAAEPPLRLRDIDRVLAGGV